MALPGLFFNAGFFALQVADTICLLLRFGWLAWLSIRDGLSIFRKHSPPTNSDIRTLLWFGKLCFVRVDRREQIAPACYNPCPMAISDVLQQLDDEIKRLQEAKRILEGFESHGLRAASSNGRRGPRKMSASAKARISAAQKKRWAKVRAQKKAA